MSNNKLIHQNKKLKQFIREFNFPDPSWEGLPVNFPEVATNELSKAEKGMLTGIMLAWYIERGKHVIYKRCIKTGFTITFSIVLLLYARFITSPAGIAVVKDVSAATVSATMKLLNVNENKNPETHEVLSDVDLDNLDPVTIKKEPRENKHLRETVDEYIQSTVSAITKR